MSYVLMIVAMIFSFQFAKSQGTWTALANLSPNQNQGVLFMLSDGTVICKSGGGGGSGSVYDKLTPNSSGSYVNGTWTSLPAMNNDRRFYSSQLMQDGRMYVCGGEYGAGGSSGEIYNPLTNTWTNMPAPGGFVSDANSEILDDGRILQAVVGGTQRVCKIYNPATNTYSNAGNSIGSHNESTWHKLPDGTILMVPKNSFTSERYFPATNTWVTDGVVPVQLYSDFGSEIGGAAMLPDGRIWFVGGRENTAYYTPSGTSAIGVWSAGPDIPSLYGQADGPVSVLRDGNVLFTCSPRPISGSVFNNPTRFYEFNPLTNVYTLLTAPNGAANLPGNTCYQTNFVNLPNGQILYGLMGTTQYYVYTPAGSSAAAWKPIINSTSLSSGCGNSYSIRGLRFNGISLGSIYGDDWQMNTNYPIIRLGNRYARTFNWNSSGVDRGSSPDTVQFSIPSGLANGTYPLTVAANGIISNSINFNTFPSLTSDLTPASVCDGNPFIYTDTHDRGCVNSSWTRAAVVGIANAAQNVPQFGNINEVLDNTSGVPKTVVYVFSMFHNGYSNTQNVSVIINPKPFVVITPSSFCTDVSTTMTANGANTYTWTPTSTGTTKTVFPTTSTSYTVIGTNTYGCLDTAKAYANKIPSVNPTATPGSICVGSTSNLLAGATSVEEDSIFTTLSGTNGSEGNVFNVFTYASPLTLTGFRMNISSGTQAEVWYKTSSYGHVDVTSNTGWTKLGATVNITPAGAGLLTDIPVTATLNIPAFTTYGIIVICNGANRYTNGTSLGSAYSVNQDLYITQGHGGTGFGGNFNLTFNPRIFNGEILYNVNNAITAYAWTPPFTLSNATISNPVADPTINTVYTVSVTDANACTNSGTVNVFVNKLPIITNLTATPTSVCIGSSSALNVTATSLETDSLLTTLNDNNGNGGNAFDIITTKAITISGFKMNIASGTQAEVWYKSGGYGNASFSSNVGWTKLGATVNITAGGAGVLTNIPTTVPLSIAAGQTYGFVVVCNGSARYTNGTAVGNVYISNSDISITEGHGGTGFGGTFNFFAFPRIWNGEVTYSVNNLITGYTWSPFLTSVSNPTAIPVISTNYTVTVTDGNGCTNTAFKRVYVENSALVSTTVSPTTICPGDSAHITTTVIPGSESDLLSTTLLTNNGASGNAFNVITSKPILITGFKMQITAGDSAEVWYKAGGYGNANLISSVGWTKLGIKVPITPAGSGAYTNIPITANLSIGAGQTYGIVVVCNGSASYLNGTAVGNIYVSSPDISITEGHGGAGINGAFSFINSPRVWSGEITYTATNTITGYSWSPNTNMNNSLISNPKVAPLTSTIYNVTVTDANGCTETAQAGVNVSPLPILGTATATPASLCLGSNVSFSYVAPAGLQCNGAFQSGFAATYAPANWTLAQVNSNGTVNAAGAPNSITMTSSNGLTNNGQTNYTITIPCNGIVSFNWDYTTVDGPQYDFPRYAINGGAPINFPGYEASAWGGNHQVGTFALAVTAGQTLTLQAHSSDNVGGACSIVINNFKAPYQNVGTQSVVWYSAAAAGSNLGNGNPQTHTPATANTFTYYAQVTSGTTGCVNTSRAATNLVQVSPIPVVGTTTSATTICQGSSTTINGTGATTYTWQPGGLSGTSIVVSPATTTTYTVTGSNAGICTATATRVITVNPVPLISGTANPGIVCPGGNVTLTGTNAGATYNWQPGNLNTASGVGIVVNPIAQTTYTVTATFSNGCTRTQTFVVLMNPTPTVGTSVVPASATFCAGGSATITANGASSYVWAPGGGIGANLIVTLANTYTVTGTNAQGCTATATRVITVNPLPTVGTTVTSSSICIGASTTITGTGANSYTWQPGALSGTSINVSPATTTTYTVTGTSAAGCTKTATRTITVAPCGSVLNLKLFIEGYYLGAGTMAPVLLNQAVAGATPTQTDSITVELRNSTAPFAIAASIKTILNTNGTATCNFGTAGSFYIAVKHRNGLQTWSATPQTLSAAPLTFDFSNLITKAFGSNQSPMGGGVFAFFSGDFNADENIDITDLNELENDITLFASGYYATDVNGDGNVDILDEPTPEANVNNFIFSLHP